MGDAGRAGAGLGASEIERLARNFDHHDPAFSRDPYAVWSYMREHSPIAHTEAHGGFWVVTKYEDIVHIAQNDDIFCSGRGITIPGSDLNTIPILSDPPEVFDYRKFLNPLFSPKAINAINHDVLALAERLVDEVIERGQCDLVEDLARPITGITTMRLAGLEPETWRDYADPFHHAVFRDASPEEIAKGNAWVNESIRSEIAAQRTNPRPGAIRYLLETEIGGRRLTDHELEGIVLLFLIGGLDSTQAAIGNAFVHLGRNPEKRRQLENGLEGLLSTAVEEFLRYQAPTQSLSRTLTQDYEWKGLRFQAGERILMSWASGNRDADEFPNPDEVVLDRHPNRHLSFGVGVHRCLGSNLARLEFRAALGQVLRRLPDYDLVEDRVEMGSDLGTVFGHRRVPVTFAPSSRRAA